MDMSKGLWKSPAGLILLMLTLALCLVALGQAYKQFSSRDIELEPKPVWFDKLITTGDSSLVSSS